MCKTAGKAPMALALWAICPNCDALTSTYAGLNKGNGRKDRAISLRSKQSKLLKDLQPA